MTLVLQGLLTLLFGGAGTAKLALPYDRFTELPFQDWATDFRPLHIRAIGLCEVAAAIAMFASMVSSSLSGLAGLAGMGMALVMSGAAATHLRRSEYQSMVGNGIWMGCALVVVFRRLVIAG